MSDDEKFVHISYLGCPPSLDNYNVENSALHRKLQSKADALRILRQEVESFRTERDQFKLMAETLQLRYSAMKRDSELCCNGGGSKSNVAGLLHETRERNLMLTTEVESLKQKLGDIQGDMEILRETRAMKNEQKKECRKSDPRNSAGMQNWKDERANFISNMESMSKKNGQLQADLKALIDEKEELVTERDAYKCKAHRLNHELFSALKANQKNAKLIDVDSIVMENKYLNERLKNCELEMDVMKRNLAKYKCMMETKRKKGIMKMGSDSSKGENILSPKQVQSLLESGVELPPKTETIDDLKSLCHTLLDNLSDKNLALSHQKKTNRILGSKIGELETRIQSMAGIDSSTDNGFSPAELLLNGYCPTYDDFHGSSTTLHTVDSSEEVRKNSAESDRRSLNNCMGRSSERDEYMGTKSSVCDEYMRRNTSEKCAERTSSERDEHIDRRCSEREERTHKATALCAEYKERLSAERDDRKRREALERAETMRKATEVCDEYLGRETSERDDCMGRKSTERDQYMGDDRMGRKSTERDQYMGDDRMGRRSSECNEYIDGGYKQTTSPSDDCASPVSTESVLSSEYSGIMNGIGNNCNRGTLDCGSDGMFSYDVTNATEKTEADRICECTSTGSLVPYSIEQERINDLKDLPPELAAIVQEALRDLDMADLEKSKVFCNCVCPELNIDMMEKEEKCKPQKQADDCVCVCCHEKPSVSTAKPNDIDCGCSAEQEPKRSCDGVEENTTRSILLKNENGSREKKSKRVTLAGDDKVDECACCAEKRLQLQTSPKDEDCKNTKPNILPDADGCYCGEVPPLKTLTLPKYDDGSLGAEEISQRTSAIGEAGVKRSSQFKNEASFVCEEKKSERSTSSNVDNSSFSGSQASQRYTLPRDDSNFSAERGEQRSSQFKKDDLNCGAGTSSQRNTPSIDDECSCGSERKSRRIILPDSDGCSCGPEPPLRPLSIPKYEDPVLDGERSLQESTLPASDGTFGEESRAQGRASCNNYDPNLNAERDAQGSSLQNHNNANFDESSNAYREKRSQQGASFNYDDTTCGSGSSSQRNTPPPRDDCNLCGERKSQRNSNVSSISEQRKSTASTICDASKFTAGRSSQRSTLSRDNDCNSCSERKSQRNSSLLNDNVSNTCGERKSQASTSSNYNSPCGGGRTSQRISSSATERTSQAGAIPKNKDCGQNILPKSKERNFGNARPSERNCANNAQQKTTKDNCSKKEKTKDDTTSKEDEHDE